MDEEKIPSFCNLALVNSTLHQLFSLFKGAVVGVSKHLCGAATDLALRCLETFSASGNAKSKIETILIALCCHHRCDWNIYVGKDRIC